MLKSMRRQVNALLEKVPVSRKPALRRARETDALLATDLPLVASEGAVEAFCIGMKQLGWCVRREGSWLYLDGPVPMPEEAALPPAQGEAACCLWLLQRHPGGGVDQAMLRDLVKAHEAGRMQLERLCAQWHKDFAAKLRKKEPLPGGLLPYLCRALKEDEA